MNSKPAKLAHYPAGGSPAVMLRAATSNDIPDIAKLISAAFEEHRDKLDPPSSSLNKTPEAVAQELQTAKAIVAITDNKVVGCVFHSVKEEFVYLAHLAVLPDYRGLGIAKALVEAVEKEAVKQGLMKVRLSVRLVLEKTRALYEKLGYTFHSNGTHAGFEKPTYVNLERKLEL